MLGLNYDFPRIVGPVDIDCMLRLSGGSLGRILIYSRTVDFLVKMGWNMAHLNHPATNMNNGGHANAAATYMWMSTGMRLREIFQPS